MIQLPLDLDVSYEVGPARFSTYERCTESRLEASRLYMWNLSLSARWWGPLSYLEVALRNALHDALQYSVGQPKWWEDNSLNLSRPLEQKIRDAERYACRQSKNQSPTVDDVVAASTFGLWTSVLHRDNAQNLWRNHLSQEFNQVRRGVLFDNAIKLKNLRNRIAHHEPIFRDDHKLNLRRLELVLGAIHEDLPGLTRQWFPGLRSAIDGYNDAITDGYVDL